MSLTEKIPINTDYGQDTTPLNSTFGEIDYHAYKGKNWPPCKPIIRHNIKEDIPRELQKTMKAVLFYPFFNAIILIFNFIVAFFIYVNVEDYVEDISVYVTNIVLSVVWLIVFGVLPFVSYSFLYKAIAYGRRDLYKWFVIGFIVSAVIDVVGVGGFPYTGFYGFFIAFYMSDLGIGLSFMMGVFFMVDFFYVVSSVIIAHVQYRKFRATGAIVVAGDAIVPAKVGTTNALPNEIDGRKVNYLPVSAGLHHKPKGTKIEKLLALPNNSFTVIDEWKRIDAGNAEGMFVLYVEGNHEMSFWSDGHIAGILNSGEVDPSTQVLTISRLENGEFVFGVANKK